MAFDGPPGVITGQWRRPARASSDQLSGRPARAKQGSDGVAVGSVTGSLRKDQVASAIAGVDTHSGL